MTKTNDNFDSTEEYEALARREALIATRYTFTRLETDVLLALFASSRGNGHDFGFIEDARGHVARNQLSGIISSLVQKRIIHVYEPHKGEDGYYTQFTFNDVDALADRLGWKL